MSLDVEINDVERNNHRACEYQKQMISTKNQEGSRSKDQESLLRNLELRLKEVELSIEAFRRDLENVRLSNDALLDRNHDLKLELESLNSHCEILVS